MKLDHYGVRNNTLSWIQDFLSDRTQTIVLEGNSSSTNPVASGVLNCICHCCSHLIKLSRSSWSWVQSEVELTFLYMRQSSAKRRVWDLGKPLHHDYTIHGHILQHVDSTKYLGLSISKNRSWNTHVDAITKKANNTLAFLRRNIDTCPQSVKEVFRRINMLEYVSMYGVVMV
jgi:hypothetical protein